MIDTQCLVIDYYSLACNSAGRQTAFHSVYIYHRCYFNALSWLVDRQNILDIRFLFP